MRRQFLVPGLVLALTTLAVVEIPTTAYADSTCYTGCTTSVTGSSTPPATGAQPSVTVPPIAPKTATSARGLAFTGADIEALAIVGAGALVVGGVVVRRSRRRRRAAA
jgi:hypothetical protein